MVNRIKNAKFMMGVAVLGLLMGISGTAKAQTLLNGSFELTSNGLGEFGKYGTTTLTDWNTNGYNFVFDAAHAQTGVGPNSLALLGPSNGGAAFPTGVTSFASPDGGNFIGADGAYNTDGVNGGNSGLPITQTVTGLTVGKSYAVNFYWAAAQQSGFNGATTDQWQVSLGSQTQNTSVINLASHSFSGWQYQSFTYVASSTSEVLSFLAVGTPTGEPPFALLDGVSVTAVPEPTAIASVGFGLLGVGALIRRRRRTPRSVK